MVRILDRHLSTSQSAGGSAPIVAPDIGQFAVVLQSRRSNFSYRRDRVVVQNRRLAIRKSGSPRPSWARQFDVLDRLRPQWGEGGVICLCREWLPLSDKASAIPAGFM